MKYWLPIAICSFIGLVQGNITVQIIVLGSPQWGSAISSSVLQFLMMLLFAAAVLIAADLLKQRR